jgi:hypothetical protein|uniref:hypothetical protein n=1 Tax=Serratia proteamaculans TaxID=28151 RepID=UPI001F4C15DE|nr:hypothetical protein [Serratia proteamaculans]
MTGRIEKEGGMFVTRKTHEVSERQLHICRDLLSHRESELMAIRQAASAHGGVYKCILECREVAHALRECEPAGQPGSYVYLFDKLALIDRLLNRLAALLPPQDEARHTARIVAEQDAQAMYHVDTADVEGAKP